MPVSLAAQILWAAIAVTFIVSVWLGGLAERLAGTFVLVGAFFALSIHTFAPPGLHPIGLLTGEALLAGGFLVLALRYASLWLGGAMILQAVQFSLHAWYMVAERPHDRLYSIVNNLDTGAILLCILAGTFAAARRRRSQAAAKARTAV